MTLFHCEGFETLGNTSSTPADLESRINKVPLCNFQEVNGGHTDDIALIQDFESSGVALRFPTVQNTRGTFFRMEWPSAYKVSTNSAHPTIVTGFRFYNAESSPSGERIIWAHLTSTTGTGPTLAVTSDGTGLKWSDTTGTITTSSVLTVNTWHYLEIEFKPVPSGNGGFYKLYVDGTQVETQSSRSLVAFTFFSSYGTRVGVSASTTETGGNRFAFDDIYHITLDGVTHTTPLGAVRVVRLTPSSDATPNNWSPSTGVDNFAMIDEVTWGTADYVEATSTGDDDHYGMTTLSASDTVHGLQIDAVVQAVDGTPNLHVGFDNGTADEVDGGTIGTGSTSVVRALFVDDPSGSAWNTASVNGAELTQRMTE